MVGDPSGKSEERNLLDADTLRHNVDRIKSQLESILDFEAGASSATLVNNADWTSSITALEFLRDVGKHVTVNQMMAKDSVKNRLSSDTGLSYTEFSYMLLQANDFRYLYENHSVELQMGGSDQWGNITLGIDLIRKSLGRHAYGATWPLVTRSDGQKFGKTADGAVWLDATRTSPYQFRQFWIQLADDDAARYLPQFSLRTLDDLNQTLVDHGAQLGRRIAQSALADEMTRLVHGNAAAAAAEAAASVLFGGDPTSASHAALDVVAAEVPSAIVSTADLSDPMALLQRVGLFASTSEARRTLAQRGLRANGQVLDDTVSLESVGLLHSRWILIRKGKTSYFLLSVAD